MEIAERVLLESTLKRARARLLRRMQDGASRRDVAQAAKLCVTLRERAGIMEASYRWDITDAK